MVVWKEWESFFNVGPFKEGFQKEKKPAVYTESMLGRILWKIEKKWKKKKKKKLVKQMHMSNAFCMQKVLVYHITLCSLPSCANEKIIISYIMIIILDFMLNHVT